MAQKCWEWFLMGLFFGLGWALVQGLVLLMQAALSHVQR